MKYYKHSYDTSDAYDDAGIEITFFSAPDFFDINSEISIEEFFIDNDLIYVRTGIWNNRQLWDFRAKNRKKYHRCSTVFDLLDSSRYPKEYRKMVIEWLKNEHLFEITQDIIELNEFLNQ